MQALSSVEIFFQAVAIEILLLTLEIFGLFSSLANELAGLGEIPTKSRQVKIKKLTRTIERIDRSDLMGIVELQGYKPCDQQIDRFVANRPPPA
jgi:hypothetical protein